MRLSLLQLSFHAVPSVSNLNKCHTMIQTLFKQDACTSPPPPPLSLTLFLGPSVYSLLSGLSRLFSLSLSNFSFPPLGLFLLLGLSLFLCVAHRIRSIQNDQQAIRDSSVIFVAPYWHYRISCLKVQLAPLAQGADSEK